MVEHIFNKPSHTPIYKTEKNNIAIISNMMVRIRVLIRGFIFNKVISEERRVVKEW